ncbi:hypothetical protein EB001_15520 [bacterium]|nr:hypothetical protein [bacterium]
MFAHKYLQHKPKNNIHIKDVYYLQKAKVVKLDNLNIWVRNPKKNILTDPLLTKISKELYA